jgi:hypothetical protein
MESENTCTNRIVIGVVLDSQVVCIPANRFDGLRTLFELQASGGTWGDLRALAPAFAATEVDARFEPSETPPDEAKLVVRSVPGVEDGDWPWPAAEMLYWLPPELATAHGVEVTTTLNGNYLHIDPAEIGALTAALEARGFECVRNDAGVTLVSGY